jgi:putative ABC transport system ATP-binding protein
MSAALLEIQGVSLSRQGQPILRSIDFSLRSGEFVVLLGPNGSGKSSLLKVINGLMRADSGHVLIDHKNIAGLLVHEIAKDVCTLTQDLRHSTFSELSVLINMMLAQSRKAIRQMPLSELAAYLATFNKSLPERLNVESGLLSGGQRQALALAMCFAHHPRLLLLDEHTSALDPKAAEHLMAMTNEHIIKENLSTIMITHSLEQALRFGTRLIAMKDGCVVADLSAKEKASLSKRDLIDLAYS